MESETKRGLWENLRDYHEDLIVQRLTAAVENCLHDLGVSPSPDEVAHVRFLSVEMAKSPAVSRGIRNSSRDIWERLYRRLYGAPPEGEPGEAPGDTAAIGAPRESPVRPQVEMCVTVDRSGARNCPAEAKKH